MTRKIHPTTGMEVDTPTGVVYGKNGKPIGTRNKYGYIEVKHSPTKKRYHAHRMVWEAMYGPLPAGMEVVVHHKNGITWDNRIQNLEATTQRQNLLYEREMRVPAHLSPATKRAICNTTNLVSAGEWAEDLGITAEAVNAVRRDTLKAATAFAASLHGDRNQGAHKYV